MKKLNIFLAAVLLILATIWLLTKPKKNSEDMVSYEKFFPHFDARQADKIYYFHQHGKFKLYKSNEKWMVEHTTGDIPADEIIIEQLLEALDTLEIVMVASQNPVSHKYYMVDTTNSAHVSIFAGEKLLADVFIGKMAGWASNFVRPNNSDMVFEVKPVLANFSNVTAWENKHVFPMPTDSLLEFHFVSDSSHYAIFFTHKGKKNNYFCADSLTGKTHEIGENFYRNFTTPLAQLRAWSSVKTPSDTTGIDFSKPWLQIFVTLGTTAGDTTRTLSLDVFKKGGNSTFAIARNSFDAQLYIVPKSFFHAYELEQLETAF